MKSIFANQILLVKDNNVVSKVPEIMKLCIASRDQKITIRRQAGDGHFRVNFTFWCQHVVYVWAPHLKAKSAL